MKKIELLRYYDMLDDYGKAIVDACLMLNVKEMLMEELESILSTVDDGSEKGDGQ